ncbi:ankyrin repeat domain-containing protein [Aspergillus alliaceus]|uniref:ankyrin repeat domain-containing protein n=1 Tax=Petromyces alliaceus TaxID=209559 RepID=UPI0012A592D9|nr:ankyrin repeat-containing domain protein [Aspergillus alliaceus]KAB8227546.1 ankyrin repeat-containing domain protein [Aspergillus alliaceus]
MSSLFIIITDGPILREFYHKKFTLASDVDLFLYGLTEDQAVEKIRQIERSIKNSIWHETVTVRSKSAITIASQYPIRHVQIVLRIYKSISEILTGFDVNCSCAAYDGHLAPRALTSYIAQTNRINLSKRSPSYESRLSKYACRGFEIFCPQLDRSRINPMILGRSPATTLGLARLLIFEQLPKRSQRDKYILTRFENRGYLKYPRSSMPAENTMGEWGDEVPEWNEESDTIGDAAEPVVQEEDAESTYHTFVIPYVKGIYAEKIKKILFNNDLMSNSALSAKHSDNLDRFYRHAFFFGTIEEKEINQTYVSGGLTFIKDDPGRQMIGSFHPLSKINWTKYAIVEHGFKEVESCIVKGAIKLNHRDKLGRTPLHLACMCSTPEIVQIMLDNGADLTSRLVNRKTALRLAAARGETKIISDNGLRRTPVQAEEEWYCESPPSDYDLDNIYPKDDTYDIDLLSWDTRALPLHLAIIHGHTDVVGELATFGASTYNTLMLPAVDLGSFVTKVLAIPMVKKLLELEALVMETDPNGRTAFHYLA